MAGKKSQDNSKKAAGNARKADSAAKKSAAAEAEREMVEGEKWQQGAKNNSKKYVRIRGTMAHNMASLRMPSLRSLASSGWLRVQGSSRSRFPLPP